MADAVLAKDVAHLQQEHHQLPEGQSVEVEIRQLYPHAQILLQVVVTHFVQLSFPAPLSLSSTTQLPIQEELGRLSFLSMFLLSRHVACPDIFEGSKWPSVWP